MSSSDPIQRFNEYWTSVSTPEAQARRDIERAEYEARYEAWRDQRQTFITDDGQIGSQPLTWDGQPLYSQETVKEGLFDASAFEQQPGQLAMNEPERSSYAEARYKLKCDDCGAPEAWNTLKSPELQLCDRCYYCRLGRP